MRTSRITMFLALLLALPMLALAQTDTTSTDVTTTGSGGINYSGTYAYAKDGVFGCNLNGAYSMSVGALSATGGAFVPVNDAAVTLNTGYLVYKECVLRGIVDRERESDTSAIQKQVLNTYLTGNNGQPYFSQNLTTEGNNVISKSVVQSLQDSTLSTVNPAYQAATKRAIARGYSQALNNSNTDLSCSYANVSSALNGNPTGSYWAGLQAFENPACRPYGAYTLSYNAVIQEAGTIWNNQLTQLNWGNGTYPVQTVVNGNLITVTPGAIVAGNTQQALQTGFNQLQNANDIDQMVGALFAGITSQVVGDSRGLAGLTQSTGSSPSYLDQLASESASGLRSSALNAAITILGANQQIEQGYLSAMQTIGTVLTNTINSLRSKENVCWNAVIQNVCVSGTLKSDNTCTAVSQACTTDPTTGTQTCPTATILKIATSTAFSQSIIDGQITPLASSTLTNIANSNTALALINQLLTGVSNTTSLDAQRISLQQLDTLVSQHALHTQYDEQAAIQSKTDITNSMSSLISDTVANWTGGGSDGTANASWDGTTYPGVGWCNVSNQTTIQAWIQKWKQ